MTHVAPLLLHLANALILWSFVVRDILWLRALSVTAGLCFIAHFAALPVPMLQPVAWNALFIALNVLQVLRLLSERRPVRLGFDAERLRAMVFPELTGRQVLCVVAHGRWRDAEDSELLIAQGDVSPPLLAVISGALQVERDGASLARLGAGRLAGEMSWMTRRPAGASVRAIGGARVLAIDTTGLDRSLEADPALRTALQSALGRELCAKIAVPVVDREA